MVLKHRTPFGICFTKNHMIQQLFRHRTVPGEVKVLLKIPRPPYSLLKSHWCHMVLGRAMADVIKYRRPARPIWFVKMQKKILKNLPVPEQLSNLPVIYKSLISYGVSFIYDHRIRKMFTLYASKLLSKLYLMVHSHPQS